MIGCPERLFTETLPTGVLKASALAPENAHAMIRATTWQEDGMNRQYSYKKLSRAGLPPAQAQHSRLKGNDHDQVKRSAACSNYSAFHD